MENRVARLEVSIGEARTELRTIDVRLTKIETRLDATATKADVQEVANTTIKWIVATAVMLGVAAITVMTFVLNNAVPRAPAAQVAPVIITVPAQPPATPLK